MNEPVHTTTAAELKSFIKTMMLSDEEYPNYRIGGWWVHPEPGFDDFNKEVVAPGAVPRYHEGACAVRSDDDFWVEAVLPYRFRELTIQEIVGVLWPNIQNPVFHPDVSAYLRPGGRHLKEPSA